tara:strand:- start:787 stop:990 length:204 start_codon:yes stop_codon:yes gene_type:complete
MPLYRFHCINCDDKFEKLMSVREKCDEKTEVECPSCGSFETQSIMHKPTFALKGAGWYKDGYQGEKQ